MHPLKHEYQYQYVILRYVPDFARGEFVNGGIVMHDAEHHNILGKVSKNAKKYKSIDGKERYMDFIESAERLVGWLREDVQEIKKGEQRKIAELVEKAFLGFIIPNAGFLDYSNIRSGITDNIDKKFEWLYKRFVYDAGKEIKKESPSDVADKILDSISAELRLPPTTVRFHYKVTGALYSFDVSFGPPCHIYTRVLGMQVRKSGTLDLRNVLNAITVLSDIRKEHPKYTFAVLLHVPKDVDAKVAQRAFRSIEERLGESKVDVVLLEHEEIEKYFRKKKLLR